MQINELYFNAELIDILTELQNQLTINNIPLLTKFRDSGKDIMVQCPYHGNGHERKPSAGIRKSDGQFHCFACGETHSLQEVISHCLGYVDDVVGAKGWQWLLKNFLTVKVEERKDVELDFTRNTLDNRLDNRSVVRSQNMGQIYVTEEELDSYRYIHPYMYERKLTNEIIELFDIGYDKDTKCITFPIRQIDGKTLFLARRSVNTKFFNYPNGVEKPLYGLYELNYWNETEYPPKEFPSEVIICESMLDALTCWVYGKYAVALNGLGNNLQFKQLRELPCRKLILATDNDDAGMKARNRIRQNVTNKIISEYIFPKGKKDINDLTKDEFDKLEEIF